MTGPNVSPAHSPHDLLRSGLVGAIFGVTLLIAVHMADSASPGFSLSLQVEPDLFRLEVARGTAPESNGAAHVG